MAEEFAHPLRVRYAECDPQGVVFNAQYLAYFDIAITELWRAAFGSYHVMLERGVDVVVAEARLRFLVPARFDEEIVLGIQVARLGNTSILSNQRITRGGEPLVEGELRHVAVDPATLQKTPVPGWMREGLAPWTA